MSAFSVQYSYDKYQEAGGRFAVRRINMKYPDLVTPNDPSFVITCSYSNTSNALDDNVISRLSGFFYSPATIDRVQYQYAGVGQLVGTRFSNDLDVDRNLYDGTTPSSGYNRLDRFNRVKVDRWTSGDTAYVFYDVNLAYDRNSNITLAEDKKLKNGGYGTSTGPNFRNAYSSQYVMDDLNRVTEARRGVWNGTSIDTDTGADRRYTELWQNSTQVGLTQTGNWAIYSVDTDGSSGFGGAGESSEARTNNQINQIGDRTITTTGTPPTYTLTYDLAGQMTDNGKPTNGADSQTYKYDAFGRLVEVKDKATGTPNKIGQYRYNALGQRIAYREAAAITDSGTPTSWFYIVQDDQWREIAVYRGTASSVESTPKERTIYHNAGLDGRGGSSYIDLVAVRDRDMVNTAPNPDVSGWDVAADGDMDEQRFYLQNWRADVVGLMRPDGVVPSQIKYSAYGKHKEIFRADVDDGNTPSGARDGGVTIDDLNYYLAEYGGTAGVDPCDLTDDGGVTIEDLLVFLELFEAGGPALDSRVMYAGYQYSARTGLYHVRHRVYSPELGVWTRVDPSGYDQVFSLYDYSVLRPINFLDSYGLCASASCNTFDPEYVPGINGCIDWEDLKDPPPLPRTPTLKERCCVEGCKAHPGAPGVTGCCGGSAIYCICGPDTNIKDPAARDLLASCVDRWEQGRLGHIKMFAPDACKAKKGCQTWCDLNSSDFGPGYAAHCNKLAAILAYLSCLQEKCGHDIANCKGCKGNSACINSVMNEYQSTIKQFVESHHECKLSKRLWFPWIWL